MPDSSTSTLGRRSRDHDDALQHGARKRPSTSDPLVHHGRHFGRAIFAFCNVRSLLTNGLVCIGDAIDPELLSVKERREDKVFQELLKMGLGLRERLLQASSNDEIELIADLIQKGANASRADDTKGLKAAIIDWITPPGENLSPPLSRKTKFDRGFHHERTGSLLCPAGIDWSNQEIKDKLRSGEMHVRGDQWPLFLYVDLRFNPATPWDGLLKNELLVSAYKHVFTSPSSVDSDETKATKSGNARIHGMSSVTPASIVYIATQVRFALSSAGTFSRSDTVTDSESFYISLFDLLDDVRERREVQALLEWWNRRIFPHSSPESVPVPVEGSPLDRIRQIRAEEELAHRETS